MHEIVDEIAKLNKLKKNYDNENAKAYYKLKNLLLADIRNNIANTKKDRHIKFLLLVPLIMERSLVRVQPCQMTSSSVGRVFRLLYVYLIFKT